MTVEKQLQFLTDRAKDGLDKGWTFTAEEKVILRNLHNDYQWMARDEDGSLFLFSTKPTKGKFIWNNKTWNYETLTAFGGNLFKTIKWEDNEPCNFRNYL